MPINKTEPPETFPVKVRWHDGYVEEFEVVEARAGAALLWLRLSSGETRHIPLNGNVRWFSGLK